MRNLLLILFSCLPIYLFAGNHYIYPASVGSPIVTATSPFTLGNSDTIQFIGNFDDYQISNINLVNVVMDFRQGPIFHHNSGGGSLDQIQWNNLSGVTFLGLSFNIEWYGVIYLGPTFHDNKFLQCRFINTTGHYSDQRVLQYDWPFSSAMVFTGSKSQTYYSDTMQDCRIEGFIDCVPVIMGTDWNTGTTPAQINRSIMLDPVFLRDTVWNVDNTSGTTVGAFSGTGFNALFDQMSFLNISGPSSGHGAHNETILWYGTAKVLRSRQSYSYASMFRNKPQAWTGLPGYRNGAFSAFAGNATDHQLSYTPDEAGTSGNGNRDAAHGFFPCQYYSIFNTTYATVRTSYNPPGTYFGFAGADGQLMDTMTANYNSGARIEYDFPWDSAGRGYILAEIGAPVPHKTLIGNRVFENFSTHIYRDTTTFYPGDSLFRTTPATVYSWYDHDLYGTALPVGGSVYSGAVQPTIVPPITCTTNLTPTNGSTVSGQTSTPLTWAAQVDANSYQVWIGGSFVTNTSSLIYNATGLTAATNYGWYVVPQNATDTASGCASTATNFTTNVNPPSCTSNLLPINGSTLATQNTAALSWSAAAGATSYDLWLDGSFLINVAGTSYGLTGLATNSSHTWFVNPKNGAGTASCAGTATTFTTANTPPPTFKTLIIRMQ